MPTKKFINYNWNLINENNTLGLIEGFNLFFLSLSCSDSIISVFNSFASVGFEMSFFNSVSSGWPFLITLRIKTGFEPKISKYSIYQFAKIIYLDLFDVKLNMISITIWRCVKWGLTTVLHFRVTNLSESLNSFSCCDPCIPNVHVHFTPLLI